MQITLPAPILIDHVDALERLKTSITEAPLLAVDTESNSLYAYKEKVCLIQISTDQADFLIDPLAFPDTRSLDFVGEVMESTHIEKIFHAAEYDVMVLKRDFGWEFRTLFDTMLAARILGWNNFGLGSILEERFEVTVNKVHQRANWGKRPLSAEMVQYAQMDIHYLIPLRHLLLNDLKAAGSLEEAHETFDEVANSRWRGADFNPQGFWRINGARELDPVQVAILSELYQEREKQAQRINLPVFKIVSDQTLLLIATHKPEHYRQLEQIQGVGGRTAQRHHRWLLECVARGQHTKPPTRPSRNNGVDEVVMRRFEALHLWRKTRAEKRGVSSDVVLSKDALWEISELAPRTVEELQGLHYLGPWRKKTYGEEILRVLESIDLAG
jgi:ribonuclease D